MGTPQLPCQKQLYMTNNFNQQLIIEKQCIANFIGLPLYIFVSHEGLVQKTYLLGLKTAIAPFGNPS